MTAISTSAINRCRDTAGVIPPNELPGRLRNQWPVGVAITLLPAYLVAHGLSHVAYALSGSMLFEPNSYLLLYQVFSSGWLMMLGAVGFVLLDRLVTARYGLPGWAAAGGVLGVWIFSTYQYHYIFHPYSSHIPGPFWLSVLVYALHRFHAGAVEGFAKPSVLIGGAACMGMAIACRPSNVLFLPVCGIIFAVSWQGFSGSGRVRAGLWLLAALAIGAIPILAEWLNDYLQRGAAVQTTPQDLGYREEERFIWTDPALLRSLFSSRCGLFFWSPMLLLAMWGTLRYRLLGRDAMSRRLHVDPLVVGLVVAFGLIWYINSAWYAWWFGHASGGRAYIELTPLFVIGLASALNVAITAGGW